MFKDSKQVHAVAGISGYAVIDHGAFVANNDDEVLICPFGIENKSIVFSVKIVSSGDSVTQVLESDNFSIIQIERIWNQGAPHAVVGAITIDGPEKNKLKFDYSISFVGEPDNFAFTVIYTILTAEGVSNFKKMKINKE